MKTLASPTTLTLEPLSTENSEPEVSPLVENLAPSECNAAVDSPFFAGDFVWAKVKGRPWWPALISPPYEASDNVHRKKDSVLVACFGDGDTFALSDSKLLKPFLEVFDEMSMQSSTESFLSALDDCVEEVGRNLQLEITCHCVPVEDRPKTLRRATCGELPVANYSPREFLYCVLDVARDIQAVNMVDAIRLRSLMFAFGKFSMQGEDCTFHRRCSVEELVDKVDLDALPLETVSGKEEEEGLVSGCWIVKSPGLSTGTQQQGRRRSMEKLIAEMDLDTLEIDEEEEEEQSLRSKKRKKGKLEVVKAEEEPSSSSGRRERKKSKYLSPPYTNLGEEGKFVDLLPMSLKGKTPRKAACFLDPGAAWSSAIVQCSTEEEDNKSPLLKIEKMPAHDIFSEFVATTKNALHLKWNRFAGVVKFFFTMYRSSMYSSGAEFEDYQKLVLEFFAENEYAVGKAEKPESTNRNRKHGSCKGIDLDFKLQKSNSKQESNHGSKLDSEVNCKYGTNLNNDMDSRQQKKDCSEKQKPRRKMLKEGANQGPPLNLGHCMADISDEGKEKQKPGKIKISSKDKTSQGALVDSNSHQPNVLDGGKKKQNSGKKKMLNDGICKEALSHLNLNMGDASDEDKLEEGMKICKIDAFGAAAVNVDLQMISSFHEGGLEKKERVSKDVANVENDVSLEVVPIICHKPASADGKRIEIKKDVNGKSIQNLGEEDAKLPEVDKSGRKKKGGTGPPKAKSRGRKNKKVESSYCSQAALHLTFHSGIVLPSIEDLIVTYSKYGALIHNRIELLKESNSARVVFAKSTCAENAFKDKAGPYGSVATYGLHYLSENLITFSQPNSNLVFPSRRIPDVIPPPQISDLKSAVCKPPLPYIRKSLETMISTLTWSSSLVNNAGSSSDVLKPEARDNLVGEMQGLLHKVDKMLNGPGSSSSD